MIDVISAIQLIRSQGVGPRTYYGLIKKFGSIDEALLYVGEKAYPRTKAEEEVKQAEKLGITVLIHSNPLYPETLSHTYDAPPVLFYKGNLNLLQSPQIAIVGTRNSSAAGLSITKKIAADLGASGFVITSGLARGIDTEAHKATLKTGTIAVVAGGLDVVYPPENKKLYDQIAESGLIIGENPIGTEPLARHFPQRNRIIAGLAKGVLVVEAAKKSGSMITADYALREGREVFAVPGSPLDPRASGTNYLIKNGAVLVEDASDIIDNLGKGLSPKLLDLREEEPDFFEFDNTPQKPESANSNDFINFLSQTPVTPDELALRSGASISIINQTLLELEMDGKIERHIGGKVCLKVA